MGFLSKLFGGNNEETAPAEDTASIERAFPAKETAPIEEIQAKEAPVEEEKPEDIA